MTTLKTPRSARWVPEAAAPAILCVLLALGLLLAGCSNKGRALASDENEKADAKSEERRGKEAEKDKKEDELPPVEVVSLGRGPIEAVLRFSTNLEAESQVQVFSQAARLVTELLVEEGDRVRKGQVLLRLQDEEQKSELTRIESQLAKARREYQRQENLFAQNLISEQVMNEATYEVEQLEIALGDARRNLSYTEVKAPIAGTVTGRHVNLGDQVTVNQHLFDLVDFDSIVARVYVPEKELSRLAIGQAARLHSDSIGGGEPRLGEVVRVAPIVDPRSGTVKVTVGIPRNQGLSPGMYVEVELVTDTREDALLVPKQAVVYDQNQAFVYRLREDSTVERIALVVELEDREHVLPAGAPVAGAPAAGAPAAGSGLAVGDRIVVAGQAGLKNGAAVRLAGRPADDTAGGEAS